MLPGSRPLKTLKTWRACLRLKSKTRSAWTNAHSRCSWLSSRRSITLSSSPSRTWHAITTASRQPRGSTRCWSWKSTKWLKWNSPSRSETFSFQRGHTSVGTASLGLQCLNACISYQNVFMWRLLSHYSLQLCGSFSLWLKAKSGRWGTFTSQTCWWALAVLSDNHAETKKWFCQLTIVLSASSVVFELAEQAPSPYQRTAKLCVHTPSLDFLALSSKLQELVTPLKSTHLSQLSTGTVGALRKVRVLMRPKAT